MSVTQPRCVLRMLRLVPIMIKILSRIYADSSVFIKNHKNGNSFIDFFVKTVI